MAATSKDGPELHKATVGLAQGRNYGAITTVLPSGKLQTHPIWVHTDGERLVVNTETHRRKYKNVERDPKVTLTIRDEENPYRYTEVRGEVVEKVPGPEARDRAGAQAGVHPQQVRRTGPRRVHLDRRLLHPEDHRRHGPHESCRSV